MKTEWKIAGINPILILLSIVGVFGILAAFGGELLSLSYVGFEVIFPIFTSISVSEWGRFRADTSFDLIAAQSRSLFRWVLFRFAAIFMETAVFALAAMALTAALRREMPVSEMILLYLSPAFFLSTVSCLLGMCFSQEHMATLLCGILWLSALMARSLLQLPGAEYFYLFLLFAEGQSDARLINKAVLFIISLLLWWVIFLLCKRKKSAPFKFFRNEKA